MISSLSSVYTILLDLLPPLFFNEKEYFNIYVKKIYNGMKKFHNLFRITGKNGKEISRNCQEFRSRDV